MILQLSRFRHRQPRQACGVEKVTLGKPSDAQRGEECLGYVGA
jgi:hypothetical protein